MGTFEVEMNAFCIMIWLQAYGDLEVECGGLTTDFANRRIYLQLSSQVVKYLEGLGDAALLE